MILFDATNFAAGAGMDDSRGMGFRSTLNRSKNHVHSFLFNHSIFSFSCDRTIIGNFVKSDFRAHFKLSTLRAE
ncbi:MAG: hypothetical protein VR65_24880 [Desulfobulbaceae bacterium BRH_c16a]|nr:MAG: hypothetical protein VR65_24880 [Desulfobulbaceae bacterium BRH_c16a]